MKAKDRRPNILDDYSVALINTHAMEAGATRAPFGYYGAKQRIAKQIISGLPPHNAWVEAFCGSAALTLAKIPAPIEVINDLDGQVVNLFEQLRTNSKALCEAIALTPYARRSSRTRVNPQRQQTHWKGRVVSS